jgi:hypothetical protein
MYLAAVHYASKLEPIWNWVLDPTQLLLPMLLLRRQSSAAQTTRLDDEPFRHCR